MGNHTSSPSTNGHSVQKRNWPSQLCLFAKNFVRHPNRIGWIFPSSRFVVEEVLSQIDWSRARVIVEYGPGLGSFTREILRRMRPDATLVALEINDEFCRFLSGSLSDPRFKLLPESATEIDAALARLGLGGADYVISGIPFKTLLDDVRREIVRKTHGVLRPEGEFLVYQMSGAVLPYLERVFGRVRQDFELLNILPARLFYCSR